MKRAVGYCVNMGRTDRYRVLLEDGYGQGPYSAMARNFALHASEGCEDFGKGCFLLNFEGDWFCPRCKVQGHLQHEEGFAEHPDLSLPFKEVRVEYNFDAESKRFREIAVVRDESILGSGGRYTLLTPLIKTEQRALKVAESLLASLQRNSEVGGAIPRTTETLLSFDDDREEFSRQLAKVSAEWANSSLSQSPHNVLPMTVHV